MEKIEYKNIYEEDVRKIRKVFKIFQNNFEQAEAEVVPSSSLVEVEVWG